MKPSTLATTGLWFLLLCATLLIGINDAPLQKIQEVRIAETAREMIVSGDWLVPRYNGELRLQKPPLPYWLSAASYSVFGVSPGAARIPAALSGVALVILLFAFVRKQVNAAAAFTTALVLVSTNIGLRYLRNAEADATLIFFVTVACCCGYALVSGLKVRPWLFFLAMGLGFLTKGPAALAIPLLTTVAFALVQQQTPRLKALVSPSGWLLCALIGGAWYLALLVMLPDAMSQFVGNQIDETYIRGTHAKPLWWYTLHLFDFFAPWSLFLPVCVAWFWRQKRQNPLMRFAGLWFTVTFLLLHLTVNKQMQYALLLLPPLAIMLGMYLTELGSRRPRAFGRHTMVLVAAIVVLIFLTMNHREADDPDKTEYRDVTLAAPTDLPSYQLPPGNGAFSFYANRVVPPVNVDRLRELTKRHGEILVFADKGQQPPFGEVLARSGGVSLWRLRAEVGSFAERSEKQ